MEARDINRQVPLLCPQEGGGRGERTPNYMKNLFIHEASYLEKDSRNFVGDQHGAQANYILSNASGWKELIIDQLACGFVSSFS